MGWHKTSRQSRGYGAQWERDRLAVLARDCYLCQCPLCKGGELRVTIATEVDHILPKAQGGTDDHRNLRAVNRECHARLSIEQKGQRMKQGCDRNGNPIDASHHWNA